MTAATRAGTARPISRGPSSITVTAQPSAAAELASSSPMNPPPITATRRPGAQLLTQQGRVRAGAQDVNRGAAERKAPGPRAGGEQQRAVRQAPAVGQLEDVRRGVQAGRLGAGQEGDARLPQRAASQIGLSSPVLDSGGRSYGGDGSAPARMTGPSQPSSRRANAARVPHSPAPAITMAGAGPVLADAGPGIS